MSWGPATLMIDDWLNDRLSLSSRISFAHQRKKGKLAQESSADWQVATVIYLLVRLRAPLLVR
jgi:hypothetical protein